MLVRESISFERGLDSKKALGVGKRVWIENWFKDIENQKNMKIDYEIKEDGNIYVDQFLDLMNTNVTELPDNLKIKGWLNIMLTNITKLPKGLYIGTYLFLSGTKIKEYPEDMIVGDKIISEEK